MARYDRVCSYIVTPVGTVGAVGIVTHQGGMVGGALNRLCMSHMHAIPQFAHIVCRLNHNGLINLMIAILLVQQDRKVGGNTYQAYFNADVRWKSKRRQTTGDGVPVERKKYCRPIVFEFCKTLPIRIGR